MIKNQKTEIERQITQSSKVFSQMISHCGDDMDKAATTMINTIQTGHKILWCGNGGSAAQAQHLSTELIGGLRDHDRRAVPSIALTTDSSFLTAWSNDTDFVSIFSRQISALGQKGDLLIGITTSGNSENVIQAVEISKKMGIFSLIFTGKDGGRIKGKGDLTITIPSEDTQRIQEGHILCGHILCELVENSLYS